MHLETNRDCVLVVDENELNGWLLAEQIRQWLEYTETVSSAEDALNLINRTETRYALIFINAKLQPHQGANLAHRIRDLRRPSQASPLILTGAHRDQHPSEHYLRLGFNDFLCQPVLLDDVQQLLQRWLLDPAQTGASFYATQIQNKTTHFSAALRANLIQALFDETPRNLADIEAAVAQNNWQNAWETTHKLHGSLIYYGLNLFMPALQRLSHALRGQDLLSTRIHIHLLHKTVSRLLVDKEEILLLLQESNA